MAQSWRLDLDLVGVRGSARQGAALGVLLSAEHLLQVSNTQVPIEEATLERSGTATVDDLKAAVSYDTPYAVRQHEDMTYRHDAGRSAKYLENAFNGERSVFADIIAARIRAALDG